jgi:hypothetical protein
MGRLPKTAGSMALSIVNRERWPVAARVGPRASVSVSARTVTLRSPTRRVAHAGRGNTDGVSASGHGLEDQVGPSGQGNLTAHRAGGTLPDAPDPALS